MNIPGEAKPARAQNTVYRMVDGEAVVVEPQNGLVNVINDVGSRIWELTDGRRSVTQIAAIIAGEYETTESTALKDTTEFFAEMLEKQLVQLGR